MTYFYLYEMNEAQNSLKNLNQKNWLGLLKNQPESSMENPNMNCIRFIKTPKASPSGWFVDLIITETVRLYIAKPLSPAAAFVWWWRNPLTGIHQIPHRLCHLGNAFSDSKAWLQLLCSAYYNHFWLTMRRVNAKYAVTKCEKMPAQDQRPDH